MKLLHTSLMASCLILSACGGDNAFTSPEANDDSLPEKSHAVLPSSSLDSQFTAQGAVFDQQSAKQLASETSTALLQGIQSGDLQKLDIKSLLAGLGSNTQGGLNGSGKEQMAFILKSLLTKMKDAGFDNLANNSLINPELPCNNEGKVRFDIAPGLPVTSLNMIFENCQEDTNSPTANGVVGLEFGAKGMKLSFTDFAVAQANAAPVVTSGYFEAKDIKLNNIEGLNDNFNLNWSLTFSDGEQPVSTAGTAGCNLLTCEANVSMSATFKDKEGKLYRVDPLLVQYRPLKPTLIKASIQLADLGQYQVEAKIKECLPNVSTVPFSGSLSLTDSKGNRIDYQALTCISQPKISFTPAKA